MKKAFAFLSLFLSPLICKGATYTYIPSTGTFHNYTINIGSGTINNFALKSLTLPLNTSPAGNFSVSVSSALIANQVFMSTSVSVGTNNIKKRLTIVDNDSGNTIPGTNPIIWIGGGNSNNNTLSEIGFTYGNTGVYGETYAPVTIGYQLTSGSGFTKGDMVVSARSATTDTAPSEVARFSASGDSFTSPIISTAIFQRVANSDVRFNNITSTITGGLAEFSRPDDGGYTFVMGHSATPNDDAFISNASGGGVIKINGQAGVNFYTGETNLNLYSSTRPVSTAVGNYTANNWFFNKPVSIDTTTTDATYAAVIGDVPGQFALKIIDGKDFMRLGSGTPEISISGDDLVFRTLTDNKIIWRGNANGNNILWETMSSSGVAILGSNQGDNASAGNYGESGSSYSAQTNFPTTGNYGDLVSITLQPGDYLLTAIYNTVPGVATITTSNIGISVNSGNSSTGLNTGDNLGTDIIATAQTGYEMIVPSWRQSFNTTTTYYLKYRAVYSGGTASAQGRLSWVRIR